ncbi:MAG: GumC family protein [Geminicoccaceae bacterium]
MQDIFPDAVKRPPGVQGIQTGRAVTLRDVLLLLRRRRMLIFAVTVVGTAATTLLALGSDPQYTATAQILIESQPSPIAEGPAPTPNRASDLAVIATQVRIIRSRQHVTDVVRDLGLAGNPLRRKQLDTSQLSALARLEALAESIVARVPSRWLASVGIASPLPEPLEAEPSDAVMEDVVDEFGNRFQVNHDEESRVVTVSFTFPEPGMAAKIVNYASDLFVRRQLESKIFEANKTLTWMEERLGQMESDVRASEAAVESYRARNDLIRDPNARSEEDVVANLTLARNQAVAEVAELQSRLRAAQRLRENPEAVAGTVTSPMLVSLRQQELELARQEAELMTSYGERHPRVQLLVAEKSRIRAMLGEEIGSLVAEVQRQLDAAQIRLGQIDTQIAESRSRDQLRSGAQVGLRELERKAQVDRQLYEFFLKRYSELGEQTQVMTPDARVISVAKPPATPSSLSPRLFSLIGFSISLFTGGVLALILDGLDRRVRGARQIEHLFDVKVLDSVPQIGGRRERGQYRYLLRRPLSAYAESIRSIFTAIQLTNQGKAPKVLVVCSALSAEGKSAFVLSLAASAAQWGGRVLVVDLDIRHPSIERAVSGERTEGLAEVIAGGTTLEQAIRSSDGGFDYVGVGRTPANPAGFIGSVKMHGLFASLRSRYDLIVVDTPPLLAVADARVAVKLGDSVLVVTRWRHSPVSAVRKALGMLEEIGAPIAGAVITRVDPKSYHVYESEDGANYQAALKKNYVN